MTPIAFKIDPFVAFMTVSISSHVMLLGFHVTTPAAPKYAVEESVSGLEVQLVELPEPVVEPLPEPLVIEPEVIEQKESKVEVEKKEEIIEKEVQRKSILEPMNNTTAGAYVEAKPKGRSNPAPVYPRLARQRGWEGVVVLRVSIDHDGKVADAIVAQSSGHLILDESAVLTIKRWNFEPARRGVVAFASTIQLPVRFKLTND